MQFLVHGSHHHASKHAAYLPNGSENSRPFGDFQRFVPTSENVDSATIET
jgi:hypothetical protein